MSTKSIPLFALAFIALLALLFGASLPLVAQEDAKIFLPVISQASPLPENLYVSIAGGFEHTCALSPKGGVQCWGLNRDGQLGDGTLVAKSAPVDVIGLQSGVASVMAGGWHSCALTIADDVKCWGDLSAGAISNTQTSPKVIEGLGSGVRALAVGNGFTCALTQASGIKCWGSSWEGQLGDGKGSGSATPVDVIGLSANVKAIAASQGHVCAVLEDGSVRCWGKNEYGQLGDGTATDRWSPVVVTGLSGVTHITVGIWHTCALLADGSVRCWGLNIWGQLGRGSDELQSSPTPVVVQGVGDVSAIRAGAGHNCALVKTGSVYCWGYNRSGQVGNGTPTNHESTPLLVSGLDAGVTELAAGNEHSCALTSSSVMCWGKNESGQLGDGTNADRSTPVNVIGFGGN